MSLLKALLAMLRSTRHAICDFNAPNPKVVAKGDLASKPNKKLIPGAAFLHVNEMNLRKIQALGSSSLHANGPLLYQRVQDSPGLQSKMF